MLQTEKSITDLAGAMLDRGGREGDAIEVTVAVRYIYPDDEVQKELAAILPRIYMKGTSKFSVKEWEVGLVFTETLGSTQNSDEPSLTELLPTGASSFEVKLREESDDDIPF